MPAEAITATSSRSGSGTSSPPFTTRTVTVHVVKGGLDVPDPERDDVAVIASAGINVRVDLP